MLPEDETDRVAAAAEGRETAEAHAREEGRNEESVGVEEGLAESEEREVEERVKGLYEGLVRGLKRVLLEEVARRATEEYYETQKKAHRGRSTQVRERRKRTRERWREAGTSKEAKGRMSTHSKGRTEGDTQSEEEDRKGGEHGASGKGVTRRRNGRGQADRRDTAKGREAAKEDEEQSKGPHGGEQQGESSRKKHRQDESAREEGGTRGARAEGKSGEHENGRTREGRKE